MATKLLRTLMGVVALVAMLTACSSEDVLLDEPNAKNEITFNVTNNRASRAATYLTSKDGIEKFNLAAWVHAPGNANFGSFTSNNKPYIQNDVYCLKSNKWINENGCRYWPNDPRCEQLDFFAWVYDNDTDEKNPSAYETNCKFNWKDNSYSNDFRPSLVLKQVENASQQYDLLYATASNCVGFNPDNKEHDKSSDRITTSIDLNFNHALAMVKIDAKSTNKNIYIEIVEVGLCNIYESVDLFFPTTSDPIVRFQFDGGKTNNRTFDVSTPVISDLVKILGKGNTEHLTGEQNAFMVLPKDYTNDENVGTDNGFDYETSQCIRVKCKVWNVADGKKYFEKDDTDAGNYASDLVIYGEKKTSTVEDEEGEYEVVTYEYKDLYIPIVFNWQSGYIYTYTLSFGDGHAGFDVDGKPALVKVDFGLKLEEWLSDPQNITEPGNNQSSSQGSSEENP